MNRQQQKTLKFFSMLYGPCQDSFIELRPFTVNYRPCEQRRKWVSVNQVSALVTRTWKLRKKLHLFYGVATRTEKSRIDRKATEDYVKEVPALYADLDFEKYKGGREEAFEIIQDFSFAPSCLIFSGNGYHCYYFLKEPYNVKDKGIFRIKRLLKILQDSLLQADPTPDVTRVLRIPYSFNIKDPNKPKLVQIVKLENRRYSLRDFEDQFYWWIEARQGRDFEKSKTQIGVNQREPEGIKTDELAVSERIKRLIKKGKSSSDHYRSRSEADQAVITALISAGYTNQVIKRVFKQNPDGIGEKFYSKGNSGEQYLNHSIASARDFLSDQNKKN